MDDQLNGEPKFLLLYNFFCIVVITFLCLTEARDVFCYFDTRGDDRISVAQVGDVLRALGQNPTEAEIEKCCANWPDTEVRITFEDFLPILHTVIKNRVPQSEEKIIEGLSHFDKEGSGYISVAELRHLLTTLVAAGSAGVGWGQYRPYGQPSSLRVLKSVILGSGQCEVLSGGVLRRAPLSIVSRQVSGGQE
ncbi:Myosin-2 essential light chain [Trichuris trichiura]|uniref:Myosin-2 essential light chain n=1 Tax=Trichuris trichiura TaxID=36087 RepID=A0A077ZQT9_TRITR|nr:Myosin-2 essential light chain [Trichuris trichiura]